MTHARAPHLKSRVASPVAISDLAPRADEALLEQLREALHGFGAALTRLRWHSRDDYAQALIAACAEAAGRFAEELAPAGRPSERPAGSAAQFYEQESCAGLVETCRALGERALATYDRALERQLSSGALLRQRAELNEVVALLAPLSRMLCTERLLVDARLEAALERC